MVDIGQELRQSAMVRIVIIPQTSEWTAKSWNTEILYNIISWYQHGGISIQSSFLILADFTYDTPEEVAEAFGSSLQTTVNMHEKSGTPWLYKSLFPFRNCDCKWLGIIARIKQQLFFHISGQAEKQIRLDQGGLIDIYIALDASDSIEEKDFNKAKEVIKKLLLKVC